MFSAGSIGVWVWLCLELPWWGSGLYEYGALESYCAVNNALTGVARLVGSSIVQDGRAFAAPLWARLPKPLWRILPDGFLSRKTIGFGAIPISFMP